MVTVIESVAQFNNFIKDNNIVVVDFWASWCGPCIRIAPWFKEQAEKNTDVKFGKVDVDENSDTAEANGIKCMPTFKFYKNGELVDTVQGANKEKIVAMMNKLR